MQIKVVLRADVSRETYDKVAVISGMDTHNHFPFLSFFFPSFPISYMELDELS